MISKASHMNKLIRLLILPALVLQFVLHVPDRCHAGQIKILSAEQVKQHMAEWIILDARPLENWKKQHIPGAVSMCWENYTRVDESRIPYRVFPVQQMSDRLGRLGISEHSAILVYGDADESWGGEGWVCWLLSWLGHKGEIAVLDGGIQAWEQQSYPLAPADSEKGARQDGRQARLKPVDYVAHPDESMRVSARLIHDYPDKYRLVDTRSTLEWFKGHIPGAVHISWKKFFNGPQRTPISDMDLKKLLEKKGVLPAAGPGGGDDHPAVVYYCTGGIRSGYAWMVHHLSGLPAALNFEGGTAEWEKVYP